MLKTSTPTRARGLDDLLSSQTIAYLEPLDLTSRKVFFGKLKGERRSKRRGHSVEFADHRPYSMGDDTRHIDWNIYARLDTLFLKMFLEEEDLSLQIVIDASASTDCGEPNKFLFMQRVAASLAYVGLCNNHRVSILAMGDGAALGPSSGATPSIAQANALGNANSLAGALRDQRGRRKIHDVSRFLCSLSPVGSYSFKAAAERIAMTRRGKGIMIVLSDFFFKEGYEDGLRRLVGHGYDVYCIQVLSPQELEPTLTGDLNLLDVEDRDAAEITVSAPLIKRYKAVLGAYCSTLEKFCLQRGMQLITVRSDTPVQTLLVDYLRRKGVVK
jgi:uncharacterized protein (DUF58 family)